MSKINMNNPVVQTSIISAAFLAGGTLGIFVGRKIGKKQGATAMLNIVEQLINEVIVEKEHESATE